MADEEEQDCCPLCMEELDITDKTFDACPCGYQIKNEYNGLCPACRTPYSEISKQKNTLDREDVVRRTKQRKQKEKNDRRNAAQSTKQTVNRKSLANVRVMQRNLVYAIGLPQTFADEDTLRSAACFGQYGKIVKAVVNKSHLSADRSNATASAYITFSNKEDALACIIAIDGYYLDGSLLRASFGTTKYCNFFLRNLVCNNPDCLYLHELGEQDDSFTKEEMQSALHSGKAAFRESTMNGGLPEVRAGSEFPPPYRPQAAGASSASGAPSEQHADAQRKAQSAAAIYKLKQSAHRSDSSTSSPGSAASSSTTTTTTISEPFSKIVAGGAARAPSPELTMAEKLMESNSRTYSAPQLLPPPVPKSDDASRKPNLHVDTSSSSRERDSTAPSDMAEEAESVIVGPLEALKLATRGSSSQEPAWAQPFPSPSVVLPSEEDRDDALNLHHHHHNPVHAASSGSVFSPFGLGFDGGIHRGSGMTSMQEPDHVWGVASAFKDNNHENDPLGTNSGMSHGSAHNSSSVFASPPPPPLPMQQPSSAGSASSSLSFASIDAIFSGRTESSDALAGLLGVQLSNSSSISSVSTPLSHGSSTPQVKTPANNGRSSRFAFANQPSGLEIPSSPAAPQHHHHLNGGGGIPSSPFGNSSGGSMMESQRRAPSPFGYGAAVGGLGSSASFPMHQDTSAFPPLGSHSLHHHHQQQQQQLHHAPSPSPFGSSSGGGGGFGSDMGMGLNSNSNDGVGMGSGLAFLQQMLPNVNISFGGDYPSHNGASNGGGLFPEMSNSNSGNGPQPPLPPSAWNSENLSSLGFDSSSGSSRLAAANTAAASGFYDPAIATLAPPPSSAGGFFGLGSGALDSASERERHHMHSALGSAVYRHPGSILNNGN